MIPIVSQDVQKINLTHAENTAFSLLGKVCKICVASPRRNDFIKANGYFDLWLFDEFHESEMRESSELI